MAVQGAGAHLRFQFPDGVHANVEGCQDRGAFASLLRRYEDHLETAVRDYVFVLPRDVYPGSKTVQQSATAFMCVLEVSVPLRLQSNQVEDIRWLLALFRSDELQDMSMARLAGAIQQRDYINMDAPDAGV